MSVADAIVELNNERRRDARWDDKGNLKNHLRRRQAVAECHLAWYAEISDSQN